MRAMQDDRMNVPSSILNATDKWLNDNNNVLEWLNYISDIENTQIFHDSGFHFNVTKPLRECGFIPSGCAYTKYNAWCRENGYQPEDRKNFITNMADLGFISNIQSSHTLADKYFDGKRFRGFKNTQWKNQFKDKN